MLEMLEDFSSRVKSMQTAAMRTDPNHTRFILVQRSDDVVAQTVGVVRVMLVYLEVVTVILVQSVLRANPQEAPAILQNGVDGILGESLFNADALDLEIIILGVERIRLIPTGQNDKESDKKSGQHGLDSN